MAGTKKRVKRTLTREEVNNQYLNAIFNEFIAEKKALGRVDETLKSYKTTYKKFCEYFGESAEETGNIIGSMFVEWTNAMRDEGLKAATINHNLSDMRTFMYWCMDKSRQYIDRFRIRLIKVQEEMPKDYTVEEVKALLRKPDRKAKFTEWRSWAICCFVVGTGARLGTLVEIRMKDIDLKNGKVFYQHTKNKKLQTANLSPQLVKSLSDYINMWRIEGVEEDDFLFCNISGEQLSKASLAQGYRQYTTNRGVNKTNIHGLRHTFAREWFLNGGDVVQLSKILGHSTLAMSEHYMNIYADMARDRFVQYNPLDNIARSGARKTVKRKD
ncbi:tyrosine-type recombinase/integrase [Intestinimonas butyriciproducens]|uniref:tyrosine-type recombinase/integrase n=1 Tax=Intestinimonas butyriciproducens TaxID=1297617 RepID=UPI000691476C|nr:tyrosine-type recombinase/integrase [Intestinimonas butyriciproducens]